MDIIRQRGAATKGRAAKATAGVDSVEIKATIPPRQVKAALARHGLEPGDEVGRYIYFFDTPDLDLLQAGIIARARRKVGGRHDSTIKFRPVVPDAIPGRWRKHEGFKVEADASDKAVVTSASLTMPVEKGLIKRVAAGEEPIRALFTESQILFLSAMTRRKLPYEKMIVLGPVEAFRWKFEDPGLPWPITGELWRRPDGQRILEASVKAPVSQAAAVYYGFMAFLAEAGAERDGSQQPKTRWALEYFAGRARKQAEPARGK